MKIVIPLRGPGRPSAEANARYVAELKAFCRDLLEIDSTLTFKVSSRGWCYILEDHGLKKGDFDQAQKLINDCRKSGLLPIYFTAQDESRAADGLESLIGEDLTSYARTVVSHISDEADFYRPTSFWEDQEYYVEMMVEKVDLKTLFRPICRKYCVGIQNASGWSDIHQRARIADRFSEQEAEGKTCVLLYCGDHDPGGLQISQTLRENFDQISGGTGWYPDDLIIDRFGLNYDFIQANNLTWIDNLQTSSGADLESPRHPDHKKPYVQSYLAQFGARKVEANALVVRPEQGRQLCLEAILKYVDEDIAEEFRDWLEEQRDAVRFQISRLMGEPDD